jgi:HEAT repeat protein
LDGGGLPLWWLGDVRSAESVALLAGFVTGAEERLRDGAVAAIALHAGPEAVDTLIEIARRDASAHVRGQALFWLAQKAGKKAVAAIGEAVTNDPETEVKKRAVFALSQLREEGVPMLIQVARTNRNPDVRKQAIFWLGQSKDPRALGFFEEVLTGHKP